MNVVSFIANVFVGLWLVPYLVNHIGKAAYGLVPLAMVFTEYINVINVSINNSITRFLTIDIQNNDWLKANHTFNTAFFAMLGLVLIQIPLLGYLTIDITQIINVPETLIKDTYYLFGFTFAGYLISLYSSIFSTVLHSYNRLDLRRMIDISRIFVRVGIIVILFVVFSPSLKFVGIANFAGALFSFILSYRYWRKFTPDLVVRLGYFRRNKLRELLSMGGWMIVNKVGFLLFLKIDLLVINRLIGPKPGGEYAAVQQWNTLFRTVASVLAGVISPMILISFANERIKDVIRFGSLGVEFLALFIGIATGVVCGFASELLFLWLGQDFVQFSLLLIIMVAHFVINLGVMPLFSINTAMNRMKVPGLVTFSMGAVNLVLAIIFITQLHLGIIGVALAGAIVLTLKNGLFTPWYAARILEVKTITFFKPLIRGIVLFVFTFALTHFTGRYIEIDNWAGLIFFSAAIFSVSSLLGWFFLLRDKHRKMLIDMLPDKIKRKLGRIIKR